MSLYYLVILEMLIRHVLPLCCDRKKLQNLSGVLNFIRITQVLYKILQKNIARVL